ncbi:MAG TPA: DUF4331 family protein [Bryocella sp.]|nr:DUF4331 family protein [Bryocella sp.]
MTDHVDGPRQIGDPSADLTDLFAFTSPENPEHTVVALCVFPSAGSSAMFSNAVDHVIAIRRVNIVGTGYAGRFKTDEQEIRFTCKFGTLEPAPAGGKPAQKGTCTLPRGQALTVLVHDESGASTADGTFRVFAGLWSDPFCLAWFGKTLTPAPNLLQHDNVLCVVIEFDTRRVLDPSKGTLFGVIAETVPVGSTNPINKLLPRIDWVGRPEQTNMRLYNAGMEGGDDVRDLWNEQIPFAIDDTLRPAFLKQLEASLHNYDMRDGREDWPPDALAAVSEVFLDDFLVFDVSKPITDASYLEIERSVLEGHAYSTGGGRTVNVNVMDVMFTWAVNHGREQLRGGVTVATKPGTNRFPYFATPNTELQIVSETVDLLAAPGEVWSLIGPFGGAWHPLVADIRLTGTGIGQLRTIRTIDGKRIIERLEEMDDAQRLYRYTNVSGIPASNYLGTLSVRPAGSVSSVEWRVQFLADNQPDFIVKVIVSTLLKAGLESLKPRFGAAK